MSTDTFLRLPEEKRARVLDAAWEEFTSVPFSKVSINQIVRRARIPRGSFYQYFTDKSDLFGDLVESIREEITGILAKLLRESGGDPFQMSLTAFDRFRQEQEQGSIPLLDRCIGLIRNNQGMDPESFFKGKPEDLVNAEVLSAIDLSLLRRQDTRYVLYVTRLIGASLAGAVMETLCHPERGTEVRQSLAEELAIIQYGCLRAETEGGVSAWTKAKESASVYAKAERGASVYAKAERTASE